MVRSFRSFKSLEFHRTIYKDVLRQLHLKLKPVMIGCGDGLTKPNEPQPTDDPIIFPYIYDQIKDYNVLCTKMEFLLESNRNLWRQITSSQGSWTYIPSAWEFVVFTKPEKPKTDMIKFGVADPQLETFDLRKSDLTDEELESKLKLEELALKRSEIDTVEHKSQLEQLLNDDINNAETIDHVLNQQKIALLEQQIAQLEADAAAKIKSK